MSGLASAADKGFAEISGAARTARVPELQRQLPGLTSGEGVMESSFSGYRPVKSDPPTRRQTTVNPLDREDYLRHLAGRTVEE